MSAFSPPEVVAGSRQAADWPADPHTLARREGQTWRMHDATFLVLNSDAHSNPRKHSVLWLDVPGERYMTGTEDFVYEMTGVSWDSRHYMERLG